MQRIIKQHLPFRGLTLASTASGLPSNIRLDALSVTFRPFNPDENATTRPVVHLYVVSGEVSRGGDGARGIRAGIGAGIDAGIGRGSGRGSGRE